MPDTVIATVGVVKEEVAAVAPIEGEAPAEPEVIGKGKKEEEGEGGERASKNIADCQFAIADWLGSAKSIRARSFRQSAIGNRKCS